MIDPPSPVARLAKALFTLDTLIDARTSLLRTEPLADPDGAWRALHTLVTQCQMIADLLDPLLQDEALLWDAIHWIRDADTRPPPPPAPSPDWYREP